MDARDRELIAELYRPLRRFAAVVAPPEVDPDDLVQDALVRTLRRGGLAGLDAPLAYLRRAMLNLASNHRRRLGRGRRAVVVVGAADQAAPAYPSDLADLLALPVDARAVLYLTAVEGYTYAEVAEVLGCTEAAARQRASRARRRLRHLLAEEVS